MTLRKDFCIKNAILMNLNKLLINKQMKTLKTGMNDLPDLTCMTDYDIFLNTKHKHDIATKTWCKTGGI